MSEKSPNRALNVLAWIILMYLVAPVIVTLPVSLTPKSFLSFPQGEYSLQHFEFFFTDGGWLLSLWQSTVIAICSMVLATMMGTLSAIGLWRIASRVGEMIRIFLLMPLIIPPIISAMAFYRLWTPLKLLDSYLGLILAHTILATPIVIITVSASLSNFDLRLEQASRNLGASMLTTVWRVILPSVRSGILAGAIFAFILSWDEIVIALFISKFSVYTLPRRMWNGIRENTDPTVAAAAVFLIVLTVAVLIIYALLGRESHVSDKGDGNAHES